jgi:nicotinamidase-related amidase
MAQQALIIVDPLNEFVYGNIKGADAERIIPNLQRLRAGARRAGVPVIYCCDEHLAVDRELAIWGRHAMRGSEEARIIAPLAPENGDYIVPKRTYSGFHDTGLDSLLRDLRAARLLVTGFYTDPCVRHTVADAYLMRYFVMVVTDAVAALDPARREGDLEYLKRMYGAELAETDRIISEFADNGPTGGIGRVGAA